jgi:chromosome segregation ATPase
MEQANEEASAKHWCDAELSTNKQTRDTKTDGVTELTTEKDKLTADIAKLGEEIAELTQAIAEIDAAVAQATLTRSEEKATNEETVKDAQEAQTAVSQALSVLKEFYRKAATATAFVQLKDEPKKNPFQKAYTGMGGENTGVVGMLEVIGSDFARLETDTEAAEAQASKEFERFSHASSEDKAVKNQEMQDRINLEVTKKAGLTDTFGDLKAMQAELDSALVYYDKLKPSCVDSGSKYAERVQRRQAEIEGLEEALKFFEGEDLPPME